ncbi:MAG: polysaccharide deacetylase family protein [Thermoguttaceae bacterium]
MLRFKNVVLALAKGVGVFAVLRSRTRGRLRVLCYHSVVADQTPIDPRANIAVTVSQFEQQLAFLKREWLPITLADLLAVLRGESPLPERAVLVTFDDGFKNNFTLAAPLLKKYAVPATIFLTTGLIGTDGMLWTQEVVERHRHLTANFNTKPTATLKRLPNAERLAYLEQLRSESRLVIDTHWQRELYALMNWDDVRVLSQFGIDVGSHSVSHPILASLTPEDLEREVVESRATIERETGTSCLAIAYPNGGESDFNAAVIEACLRCGYQAGFNLSGRRNPQPASMSPMSIDRICITRDLSQIEFEYALVK